MHPRRLRPTSVALVVAGLIPAAGVLVGASAPDLSQPVAAPPVANAAHEVKQPVLAQKPEEKVKPIVAKFRMVPASVKAGAVPKINFQAYREAEASMAKSAPRCGIDWQLIAGIGRVESHHANSGDADGSGKLRTPIYGPTLDGTLAGNRVVTDTDGGALDDDAAHDRAVGPMQFLPETWEHYAADGNDDGKSDPQNLFDAALTTAKYLCDGDLDLRKEADQHTAVLRYNNSAEYVADVLGFARTY